MRASAIVADAHHTGREIELYADHAIAATAASAMELCRILRAESSRATSTTGCRLCSFSTGAVCSAVPSQSTWYLQHGSARQDRSYTSAHSALVTPSVVDAHETATDGSRDPRRALAVCATARRACLRQGRRRAAREHAHQTGETGQDGRLVQRIAEADGLHDAAADRLRRRSVSEPRPTERIARPCMLRAPHLLVDQDDTVGARRERLIEAALGGGGVIAVHDADVQVGITASRIISRDGPGRRHCRLLRRPPSRHDHQQACRHHHHYHLGSSGGDGGDDGRTM